MKKEDKLQEQIGIYSNARKVSRKQRQKEGCSI